MTNTPFKRAHALRAKSTTAPSRWRARSVKKSALKKSCSSDHGSVGGGMRHAATCGAKRAVAVISMLPAEVESKEYESFTYERVSSSSEGSKRARCLVLEILGEDDGKVLGCELYRRSGDSRLRVSRRD